MNDINDLLIGNNRFALKSDIIGRRIKVIDAINDIKNVENIRRRNNL